jgi:hypothetical protein
LHPLGYGNNGADLRGLSFYGGMACRVYFCPAHHDLPPDVKEIVRSAATDWYNYGLVVTETDMLNAFFREVEKRIYRPVVKEDIMNHADCLYAVRAFFHLKNTWPYRDTSSNYLGNYFFKDNLYPRPAVNYESTGKETSRYDVIFRALGSQFLAARQLKEAEDILDGMINTLAHAILPNLLKTGSVLSG